MRVDGVAAITERAADGGAGDTATVRRSPPDVVIDPAVATMGAVSAAYSVSDPPAVETPFVKVSVVALAKATGLPVLPVRLGVLPLIDDAPESVSALSPP